VSEALPERIRLHQMQRTQRGEDLSVPGRLLASWRRSEDYGIPLEAVEPVFTGTDRSHWMGSLFYECGNEVLADLHRTLELNPSEVDRFQKSLSDVLSGKAALEPLLQSRESASRARPPKVAVSTAVNFDDAASTHSTLLEIVTQDRPGLLYDMGTALARLDCNIEVALIDTEGQKAIDVFYLTSQSKKLDSRKQEVLREVLQGTLG